MVAQTTPMVQRCVPGLGLVSAPGICPASDLIRWLQIHNRQEFLLVSDSAPPLPMSLVSIKQLAIELMLGGLIN